MEWLDSITNSMHMDFSKLEEIVEDKGAWYAAVHGVTKSQIQPCDWMAAATIGCFRGMEIKVLLLRTDHVPHTKNLNDTMLANFHSNPMDLQHSSTCEIKLPSSQGKSVMYIHGWSVLVHFLSRVQSCKTIYTEIKAGIQQGKDRNRIHCGWEATKAGKLGPIKTFEKKKDAPETWRPQVSPAIIRC